MPKLSAVRITDQTIKTAKPRGRRYFIRDANLRGFLLRVNTNGSKSFYVQLDKNTKRKIGDESILTLTSARTQAKNILARHSKGEQIESRRDRKPILSEFLADEYRKWAVTHNRHGVREVKRLISALGKLGNIRIDELSQIKVERWKQDRAKQVKPATVNRELASLKASLNRATEWGLLAINPVKNVRGIKGAQTIRVRYLNAEERKRLYTALESRTDHIKYIVLLALNTGIRRGEVFGLRWKDIRFGDHPTLTVRVDSAKSKKARHIPLNHQATKTLIEWQLKSGHRDGYVFPSASGHELTDIKRSWGSLIKTANIKDFRFHDLRHDFASVLVMNGADLYSVKELLGHSTIEMTQRYAHLSPDRLRQVISALETVL